MHFVLVNKVINSLTCLFIYTKYYTLSIKGIVKKQSELRISIDEIVADIEGK